MYRKSIKSIAFLLILSLFTVAVSACQDPNRPSAKEPVTLTMWHNYGGDLQQSMDTLIDKFNSTIGKDQGIIINVEEISSSSDLNESLAMIINGDPGAPNMPDIFTGYPKIAIQFQEKGLLCNLDPYFTADERTAYVDEFIAEGRLSDGGLYVFPIAKSTEILYLNQTLFDRFAKETGATLEQLQTFEGIAQLSEMYYKWTDEQTPNIPNDGKAFYAADSWFNVASVGMKQLGDSIFNENQALALNNDRYKHIFDTIYQPAITGGIGIYDGYSSDLSKTGDLVCSTGSSAGILFYGDTITYADGTVEAVEYHILPYPVFEGGKEIALQRGGGLMVAKSNKKKEYAASVFLKWLTEPEQNMQFISKTGYLPVTKTAFTTDIQTHLETITDDKIKKMLTAVLAMYERYDFFTAPNFNEFDAISKAYETDFKNLLTTQRTAYLTGHAVTSAEAIAAFIN